MTIEASTSWTLGVLLLSLRIGPVFVLAPPFSQTQVPARVRVCFVLALAACLAHSAAPEVYMDGAALLIAAAAELMLGLAICFAFQAAFAALTFAGRVLDVQAGYGLAMVIDPGSRAQAPLFGTILTLVAGLLFFASGGHLELVRLLMALTSVIPVGYARVAVTPDALIGYFGIALGVGLSVIAAAMVTLFLIDVAIAFLSRALPQMNALMLGLQVKVIATPVMMALSAGLLAPATLRLLTHALAFVPSLD
ncbi:flagellar biosynthetic protein FliR [Paraburkholderia sp. UCT2]|uniref:flagellar biosynthetic protein FliR n=1 Tax=Paraburkholderia sp. UCT2 TaxID=2615208 RepID=UPI001654C8BF|nr:flagellar biosynthetic protein FliR [Paraburkholderia sp. UCT2]MBC8731574.1 flagellar biosynthetic protein FliR [Paraburkholderia sp. UCT2]